MKIYLTGSLRNKEVPVLGAKLRLLGFDVFDDWFAGGYEADDKWREYEEARGRTYFEALKGLEAKNIFEFDKYHLDTSDVGVMLLPCGRSAHLELGYLAGQKKEPYILIPEDHGRWDVMYQFATRVFDSIDALGAVLLYYKETHYDATTN